MDIVAITVTTCGVRVPGTFLWELVYLAFSDIGTPLRFIGTGWDVVGDKAAVGVASRAV